MTERNWRVAVVGAGPAGLYGADALLKRGAHVDVFERQFAPYGLVRYGVAPDHQKIKRTQAVFDRILAQPRLRLFNNVEIGRDVTVLELQEHYDQVLITMGSSGARSLGIPGEALPGSTSATEFVNWYNGHPDFTDHAPDLSCRRAVVVGVGNVAIDVTRILLKSPEELRETDISLPALAVLAQSKIEEVVLLARRGPNQAAFDQKEVRELAQQTGVALGVDGYVAKRATPTSDFIASFPRAAELPTDKKRVILWFCAAPVAILGDGCVSAVSIERTTLLESAARMRSVGTGEYFQLDAGLVVRAIGYSGKPLSGVPFCETTGTIPHASGRVLTDIAGTQVRGLYVAGWIKRGPTGLIGTNKSCAVETVEAMEADLDQVGPERDPAAIAELLTARGVRFIDTQDWGVLDAHEREAGERQGRVRTKILSIEHALGLLSEGAAPSEGVSRVRASEVPPPQKQAQ